MSGVLIFAGIVLIGAGVLGWASRNDAERPVQRVDAQAMKQHRQLKRAIEQSNAREWK